MFLFPVIANADSNEMDTWSFNGFGTLGYSQTDKYDERMPRRNINQSGEKLRDNGWLMDSRFGAQVKALLNDHWELVGQMVFREQFEKTLSSYVDIAFVRYHASNQWQIAIGRQAFDIFFLSDHLHTGYSYEWIRPPTEFYGFIPYDHFDGLKVTKHWGDFDNDWQWNVSIGNIKEKFSIDVVQSADSLEMTRADPIYSSELAWQIGKWRLRANFSHLKFKQEISPDDLAYFASVDRQLSPIWPDFHRVVTDLTQTSAVLRYWSLGTAWQHQDWKIQSEWSLIDSDLVGASGQRAYFSVAKRFDRIQPFIAAGIAYDHHSVNYQPPPAELDLEQFYLGFVGDVESARYNQHSISLGVRWDVIPQKALKLQCDRFYFNSNSNSIYGRVDDSYITSEVRSWCAVAFDWVF